TLVATPWLYGATTAWTIELVSGTLMLVLALWVASLLVDRRWPMVPRALVIIAFLILLQGWWMVGNARAVYDSTFGLFAPVRPFLPNATGSVDYVISFAWMLRATLLLGVICLVAEIAQRPLWLLRLWYAIAIAGGSIALLGLIQKGTGAEMIFWQPAAPADVTTFFASYYYHANAGALLNLALPVIAGLALWTVARSARTVPRTVAAMTLLIVVIAVFSNTSRMAQAIGVIIMVVLLAAVTRPAIRMIARAEKRTLVVGVFIVLLTVLAIGQAAHLDKPLGRWQQFTEQMPVDGRWGANRVAWSAVGDAGSFGFGPGSFRAVFPHYQEAFKGQVRGTWRFLHNDYLQTLLEWGWVGSALVAALFFGGIGIAIRSYLRAHRWSNRQHSLERGQGIAKI
ncbi:MAG: O-antigen ligase family protein, partial [Verrucomicrobiaceae bacterium]|nr:O-antigen ligase family protein [Verrucomicrobiaceae bacterium]